MSIQSEITRISGNVADSLAAVAQKGVTVPTGSTSDDLPGLIAQIQQGGGGGISVVETPDSHGGTIVTITAEEVNLQEKTNINPSTSSQTIVPDAGYTGLSSVQINAMPTGTAGTPIALKSPVINHAVGITPSVTNTTGYILGGSQITGPSVTVTASELVSGSETKTANGTYDVTNLAELVVNVASSGKNVQVEHGTKRVAATTYTDVGYEITVAKTGTYNVYWAGWRSSTSGTNGAQLYVNGTASGSAVTSFDATWTNVQNGSRTNVSLTKDDKVTLSARSRGTSYYMYIFFLSIEEV